MTKQHAQKQNSVEIHPTAVVHPNATLEDGVTVGPHCVIGAQVSLGQGTRLVAHVYIEGLTRIGEHCEIYPFASIGTPPQHLHYHGEDTRVDIGRQNIIREYVTINRATAQGGGVTRIGDQNFLMAYVHVAHDCLLGNHVIMANAASLAGHITIGDHAIIGGLVGIHQFVRVGNFGMVGGCSAIGQDVPPFTRAAGGYRAQLYGLNAIGLKRNGFPVDRIVSLKRAYDILFRSDRPMAQAIKAVSDAYPDNPDVMEIVAFLEGTKRGVCRSVGHDQEKDVSE